MIKESIWNPVLVFSLIYDITSPDTLRRKAQVAHHLSTRRKLIGAGEDGKHLQEGTRTRKPPGDMELHSCTTKNPRPV